MATVAAIDCGTNSIRLLIARADKTEHGWGELTDLVRETSIVRLGYGVDTTGRLHPEALARTTDAIVQFAKLIHEHDVAHTRFVATSATRDASNRQAFVDTVQALLGVEPQVISGDEEAQLSFRGARRILTAAGSAAAVAAHNQPVLVIDLGGGSTELVTGTLLPTAAYSMDIGSVRLTERHAHEPEAARHAAVLRDIEVALDHAERSVDLAHAATVIGVAGTITTVTAHALRLDTYSREAINGASVSLSRTLAACTELWEADAASLECLPYLHPGRRDIIGVGALIWSRVLQRIATRLAERGAMLQSVYTSEHDILDGIAYSALDELDAAAR